MSVQAGKLALFAKLPCDLLLRILLRVCPLADCLHINHQLRACALACITATQPHHMPLDDVMRQTRAADPLDPFLHDTSVQDCPILQQASNLRTVRLQHLSNARNTLALQQLPQIRCLQLGHQDVVSAAAVESLAALTQLSALTVLRLTSLNSLLKAIAPVPGLPELQSLHLQLLEQPVVCIQIVVRHVSFVQHPACLTLIAHVVAKCCTVCWRMLCDVICHICTHSWSPRQRCLHMGKHRHVFLQHAGAEPASTCAHCSDTPFAGVGHDLPRPVGAPATRAAVTFTEL